MQPASIPISQAMSLAVAHHQGGRLDEAERIYRQIISQNPNNADALQLLGTLLGQKGDLKSAEELIRKSLAIAPTSASAYLNLGEFLRRMGRPAEAVATILEGMRYRPSAAAFDNLASALRDLKCDDAAIDALRMAIKFDGQYLPAMLKMGMILIENGRVAEGRQAMERAAAIRPDSRELIDKMLSQRPAPPCEKLSMADVTDARAAVAISGAMTLLHRYDDAIAAAIRASELAPRMVDPLVNLGWLYNLVGRLDHAAAACERAIEINPNDAPAHLNLGVLRLLQGDFSRGWPLYEYRKQCPGFRFARYPQPQWNGKPLDGRRILLWYEQGLGDTIQFVRYVPQVANLGGNIFLAVQPELRRLVEGNIAVEQWVDLSQPLPEFDVQCSLLSLPLAMGTTVQTIPAEMPYLKPSVDSIKKWGQRTKPYRGQLRIGLSWAGRPGHINDANRSMQLKDLAPLAAPGAVFFSLQKWNTGLSAAAPDAAMKLIDWTTDLADMADTAGLIANLDLVISVDSAVAHLAGAMGARVWVLLPKAPDWRWLLGREDSPWYPTMRLFRQERLGDWAEPVGRVVSEISKLK